MPVKAKRALISVSDKEGLLEFAKGLSTLGIEIVSTGGTAKMLAEAGLKVVEISEYTGFPEILQGRVKTLHPKVHGGLLFRRGIKAHEEQAKEQGILPIDLVVVNLYPFQQTIDRPNATPEEAIENIDIGGPSMLRSAAKNHESVTVIVDPADYQPVLAELKAKGTTTLQTRQRLAVKVFETTARYDSAIARYLGREYVSEARPPAPVHTPLPDRFEISLPKARDLRYGENPHQNAALYGDFFRFYDQLQGKELSYNNMLDVTAAAELIGDFEEPTVAILKHNNPCGVGSSERLVDAWEKALATDRQAPFGGIIVVNRPLDHGLASKISEIFSEVIVAPHFQPQALEILKKKKNLRLLRQKLPTVHTTAELEFRYCVGGILVQERDAGFLSRKEWKVVTKRAPTELEAKALWFGWRVVKHVKSNAIVYASDDRTLGIGAGQMSRVDSARISAWKAKEAGLTLEGSVVASDAFFPFADGVIAAAEAGATAVVQPGGSVRDQEVIDACNKHNVAMVFTHRRHFRH
jgi:phosphoribosylaminoimidazolecarboxamide formyltransferase/IMP cyclohydrolase